MPDTAVRDERKSIQTPKVRASHITSAAERLVRRLRHSDE